jgi:RND family efflux transporter MFP subunit
MNHKFFNMKNILVVLLAAAALTMTSCGGNNTEDIKKQLEEYRQQQTELNQKIEALQNQLETSDDVNDDMSLVPVVIEPIIATSFNHFFDASGAVVAVNEAVISPEINGQIKEILVKEGDRVVKGQLLARLNTDVTDRNIEEIKTSLSLATDVFERQQRLWEQKVGSEMQYLEAKNNKANLENRLATLQTQLEMAEITAPINGVIEKVNQKKGEMAGPGMQLIYMVDLSEMLIRADVSERYISAVHRGDMVQLSFPSIPEFAMQVPVSRIGNVVNKNNRTFEVELRLKNQDQLLKPNMVAVLNINDFNAENTIVIPSRLIKEDLKGKYVYTAVLQDGKLFARKRYITPDRTYYDNTRITEGLEAGEQLILEGHNRVSDGTLIKSI